MTVNWGPALLELSVPHLTFVNFPFLSSALGIDEHLFTYAKITVTR